MYWYQMVKTLERRSYFLRESETVSNSLKIESSSNEIPTGLWVHECGLNLVEGCNNSFKPLCAKSISLVDRYPNIILKVLLISA